MEIYEQTFENILCIKVKDTLKDTLGYTIC